MSSSSLLLNCSLLLRCVPSLRVSFFFGVYLLHLVSDRYFFSACFLLSLCVLFLCLSTLEKTKERKTAPSLALLLLLLLV
ncbi:hypothetical protein CSUI_005391 [Cystoisospora suis]|uniref:Transmembrane protein n=1 Tax=Cystoisospora suis TaxID=483139 RepID=A0A2C6KXQ8_9APIC|nr:hypothetical protein CSUI_005391 [Cystoisospora suis]